MPRTTYPTALELAQMLSGAGLADCLPADLADAANEAKDQWERATDWGPYLSTGQVQTRTFTAEGLVRPLTSGGRCGGSTRLALRCGVLSLESLKVDGQELTVMRDFWLQPSEGAPFTSVRFLRPVYSGIEGIEMTGVWGAVTQLDDDVWRAVALRALLNRRDTIASKWQSLTVETQKSVVKAKESGPVRLEFAVVGADKLLKLDDTFSAWEGTWSRALEGRVMRQP